MTEDRDDLVEPRDRLITELRGKLVDAEAEWDALRKENRKLARTVSQQTLRIAELERALAAAEEASHD